MSTSDLARCVRSPDRDTFCMAEGLPNVQPNGAVEYLSPHGDLQSNVRCSVRRPDTTVVIVEPNPLRSSLLPTVLSLRRSAKLWSSGPHPKVSRIQKLLRETRFSMFAVQRHDRAGFGLSHGHIGISNLRSEIWYRLLRLLLKLIQHHSYLSQLVA